MNSFLPRAARWLLIGLLVLAAVRGLWIFSELLLYEMNGVHHGGDGTIYTAVGRGILHGRIPYADLFETKPPGMFLLSALSLYFFHSIALANIFQGLVEVGIVLLLFVPFVRAFAHMRWSQRMLCGGITLAFGILLVQYLAARAGHFQTESFGSFFVCAYFSVLCVKSDLTEWRTRLMAAFFLMCAVGLKEPFVVIAFAGSLLAVSGVKSGLRFFGASFILAVVTGATLLFFMGYLQPYIGIYLPEMMGGRAHLFLDPLWALGFFGHYIARDLFSFSPPLLAAIVLAWYGSLAYATNAWNVRRGHLALCLLALSCAGLYFIGSEIMITAAVQHNSYAGLFVPTALVSIAYWLAVYFLLRRVLFPADAQLFFRSFLIHVVVLFLAILTANMGGLLTQQYGFVVPIFFILFLRCIQWQINQHTIPGARKLFVALGVASAIGMLLLPKPDYEAMMHDRVVAEIRGIESAHTIDELMDSCGYAQYVMFGQPDVPYAYTVHSPSGPAFSRTSFTFPVSWRPAPIPYFPEQYIKRLHQAPFVIARRLEEDGKAFIDGTDIPQPVLQYVQESFSTTPPACAASFTSDDRFIFLFRKG